MPNLVKVAKLGSRVVEIFVEHNSKIADALRIVEMDSNGFELRVNGAAATTDTVLNDGDIITMIPAIKGGAIN